MTKSTYEQNLPELDLGKNTDYPEQYNPELLKPVARSLNRNELNLDELPFWGEDIWNGYEFSWLNNKGKPEVAMLVCKVPFDSENIIESKSFKLYLNGFNQTTFSSIDDVHKALVRDLSLCAQAKVAVTLHALNDISSFQIQTLPGHNIDHLDVAIENYHPSPELLTIESEHVKEELNSHLLKSNCLITNQPDWGSLFIKYEGPKINHQSLLKYIVSFRLHNEFHEQCVERIFCDILRHCRPDKLSVLARYTRRGGLDINPFRSNFQTSLGNIRTLRQ